MKKIAKRKDESLVEIVTIEDESHYNKNLTNELAKPIQIGIEKGWEVEKVEMDIKKSKVSYTFANPYSNKRMNICLNISETGRSVRTSENKILGSKKDYLADILYYKKQGITQKEIADILGISPSYVSKLLK